MIDEMRQQHDNEIESPVFGDGVHPLGTDEIELRADLRTYHDELRALQEEIAQIPQRLAKSGTALMLVFEGWDAAGKSGCIRRITDAIREDRFSVLATSAPSPEEYERHYLWRFWRTVPPRGHIALYDRSWYGRVLVERVEEFCTQAAWTRAYDEINDFERTLTNNGYLLLKFWLDISSEEQYRRFMARMEDRKKRDKLTGEDWRNRAHRSLYETAVKDMIEKTNTEAAPWIRIPAEDKKYARLSVMRRILPGIPD